MARFYFHIRKHGHIEPDLRVVICPILPPRKTRPLNPRAKYCPA
jgi:hypothetical protein